MTTIGSVEDYDELRTIRADSDISYDILLVRQCKKSPELYEVPIPSTHSGGIFVWDEFAEDIDDGSTIISTIPASGNGRWKRLFDDKLSVTWFGAKGDMKEYFVFQYEDKTLKKLKQETRRYKGTVTTSPTGSILKLDLPKESSLPPQKIISPRPGFGKGDIGKTIIMWDRNETKRFITKITAYHGNTEVELSESPGESMLGAFISWGSDDSDPIQQAIDVAKESGFSVYLPPGHYLITKTLHYVTEKREHNPDLFGTNTHELMPYGLKLAGAGMNVSVLHNEIMNENQIGDAVLRFDGVSFRGRYFSFQYMGSLKDFSMTSSGSIPGSVGIDMREMWGYDIENIAIMHMGSHAIVLRNSPTPTELLPNNTDGDACDCIHINNVYIFENGGWGIIVDAGLACNSTGRIHVERCRIDHNTGGGIQWIGQGGIIEQSGLYGNGVTRSFAGAPHVPAEVVDGAYGIFVKNVKVTPNGLLIHGCEIQDNADIQMMIAVGANIRIVGNDFKADDIIHFPAVDIQVGDGNLGDSNTDFSPKSIKDIDKTKVTIDDDLILERKDLQTKLIELTGLPGSPSKVAVHIVRFRKADSETLLGANAIREWIIVNDTDKAIKVGFDDQPAKDLKITVQQNSEAIVYISKDTPSGLISLGVYDPRTVNACLIEDNRIRTGYKGEEASEARGAPPHIVVKINRNAVGTVIGRWWMDQFKQDNTHKLVEAVEIDPYTGKRSDNFRPGYIHLKTHLQWDGVSGGHTLIPFASNAFTVSVDEDKAYEIETSKFSKYNFRIENVENLGSFTLSNPTVRVIGTPLFLEFTSASAKNITIKFDSDFDVGENIIVPHGRIVTGILMFNERRKWIPFAPWTISGRPLLSPNPPLPPPRIISLFPANGSSSEASKIIIKAVFDRLMDEDTITGKNADGTQNFTVTKGTEIVRGSIILENGVVATFRPDIQLDGASEYVGKISEKIKDKQGNHLDYGMNWSFKTV